MSKPATGTGTVDVPEPGDYRIDPVRSTIAFATRHMFGLGPVRGTFTLRDGIIRVTDPVAGSSARAAIDAASVRTGNSARDGMVRSPTYLDTENDPDISFASTRLEEAGGQWTLHGTLTVRGTERAVEVPIESAQQEGSHLRLRAGARIDRYEFGITAMKGMTGRRLTMRLDLVAERR